MKAAALKVLLIASLRTEDPVRTARRVAGALAAKAAEVQVMDPALAARVQELRTALAGDLQPLAEALWRTVNTDDVVAMRAGLRMISKKIADYDRADGLADALAVAMADAFAGNEEPEPEDEA